MEARLAKRLDEISGACSRRTATLARDTRAKFYDHLWELILLNKKEGVRHFTNYSDKGELPKGWIDRGHISLTDAVVEDDYPRIMFDFEDGRNGEIYFFSLMRGEIFARPEESLEGLTQRFSFEGLKGALYTLTEGVSYSETALLITPNSLWPPSKEKEDYRPKIPDKPEKIQGTLF